MQLKYSLLAIAAVGAGSALAMPKSHGHLHKPNKARQETTEADMYYTGNTGTNGTWGSNFHIISEADKGSYDYVVKFIGQNTDQNWTVGLWNKMGRDGGLNGMFEAPAKTFTLSPGATQWVAIDENSQGAWSAVAGSSFPKNDWGQVKSTWGEFDFADTKNGGASGFDVSIITAEAAGYSPESMKVCVAGSSTCSWWGNIDGAVKNYLAYDQSNADAGGIGGNLPSGAVTLNAWVDWDGSE